MNCWTYGSAAHTRKQKCEYIFIETSTEKEAAYRQNP